MKIDNDIQEAVDKIKELTGENSYLYHTEKDKLFFKTEKSKMKYQYNCKKREVIQYKYFWE